MKSEREGKLTLRTFKVESKPSRSLSPQEVHQVGEHLKAWKQGRVKPNAQASLPIRMVAQLPEMVQRLATI